MGINRIEVDGASKLVGDVRRRLQIELMGDTGPWRRGPNDHSHVDEEHNKAASDRSDLQNTPSSIWASSVACTLGSHRGENVKFTCTDSTSSTDNAAR